MKPLLFLISFLFCLNGFSQEKTDTIRCGDYIFYGKTVDEKKEGLWECFNTKYHSLKFRGNYIKGMKSGKWKYCGKNEVVTELNYKNNLPYGKTRGILDGIVVMKGQYKDGCSNGEWIYFDKNGTEIIARHFFKNGIPYGKWQDGNWSGQMTCKGREGKWLQKRNDSIIGFATYSDGKPIGVYRFTSEDNSLLECNYNLLGELDGIYFKTDSEGRKVFVKYYSSNLQNGPDSCWNDGSLYTVTQYRYGMPYGFKVEYFRNKRIAANGEIIVNPKYYSQEQCRKNNPTVSIPEIIWIDLIENKITSSNRILEENTIAFTPGLRNDILSMELSDTCDDQNRLNYLQTGHWKFYHENGNLKMEGDFLPIPGTDTIQNTFSATITEAEVPYKVEYPVTIISIVHLKNGWWKIYNEKGILVKEERYEFGVLKETVKK